jgi:glycine/D-amino acid oxidase-like deaminating enzyme
VLAEVRPGVIAVGAHSGHGNVLGSAAARAATAIALGEPAPLLARLLRPEHWDG